MASSVDSSASSVEEDPPVDEAAEDSSDWGEWTTDEEDDSDEELPPCTRCGLEEGVLKGLCLVCYHLMKKGQGLVWSGKKRFDYGCRNIVTPDNKYVLSDSEGVINVWDAASAAKRGKDKVLVTTLEGHTTTYINLMMISPDGLLVSATDKEIKCWDMSTFQCVRTIVNTTGRMINNLDFTADGKHLISKDYCTYITLWNYQSGEIVASIKAGNGSMSQSADGRHIIVTGEGTAQFMHVWDLKSYLEFVAK